VAHSSQPDEILRDLAPETLERFGGTAGMQIGPEQGTFMTMLARVVDLADQGDSVQGIRQFNGHGRADQRVDLVLLSIGDGLTMARKL